jgi:hypothetical protein
MRRRIRDFLSHLKTVPDAVTTIDRSSRAGVSISCKREVSAARSGSTPAKDD